MQRAAGRKLVRGREQYGPLPPEYVHARAVPVQRQRHRPHPGRREQLPVEAQPVRLHAQWTAQHPARALAAVAALAEQQPQGVREARADDDPVRLGPHATRACQIFRQRLPQLPPPGRIPGPERLTRRGLQRPAVRGRPGGPRERGGVGRALPQIVPRPTRAGRCFHRGPYGAAQRLRPLGDPGPGTLTGGQPALRDQLRVRVGHRVAGHTQVGGERTVRRQARARSQPSAAYGLPQRPDQRGPPPARTRQFKVQVGTDPLRGIDP